MLLSKYLDEEKRKLFDAPLPIKTFDNATELFDITKLLAMSGGLQDNKQKILSILQKLIENVAVSFSSAKRAYNAPP